MLKYNIITNILLFVDELIFNFKTRIISNFLFINTLHALLNI